MFSYQLNRVIDCSDGVSVVDSKHGVIHWNDMAHRLTGLRPNEVLGRFCFDLCAKGNEDNGCGQCRLDCPMFVAIKTGMAIPNFDLRYRNKWGKQVWYNVSTILVRDDIQRVHTAIFHFRDITHQIQAEKLTSQMFAVFRQSEYWQDAGVRNEAPATLSFSAESAKRSTLTRRERDVLAILVTGASTKEIAQGLSISPVTVRNHIQHILEKLGVHSRLEAVVYALEHKLIQTHH